MKLEEGMYVRTKLGIIAKCINVLEDCSYDFDRIVYQDNYNEDGFMEIPYLLIDKYIDKFSYNIIDLIEEGDYVNGMEVMGADWINENGEYEEGLAFPMYASDDLDVIENWLPLKNIKIKSIVTKEQFESMQYEVK